MHWHFLERFFRSYSHKLYVLALSITGERFLAEDAVHDALLALARSKSRPVNPEAYIYTTVRNTAIKIAGKRVRSVEDKKVDFLLAETDTPEDRLLVDQVTRSLASLTPDQRETIILNIYAGFTFREISELKHKPLNTVTSWYRRGISALQKECNKDE